MHKNALSGHGISFCYFCPNQVGSSFDVSPTAPKSSSLLPFSSCSPFRFSLCRVLLLCEEVKEGIPPEVDEGHHRATSQKENGTAGHVRDPQIPYLAADPILSALGTEKLMKTPGE